MNILPKMKECSKRLVAGAMVFSYGLGLVATNCVNSFSYGYDRLRFIKPVFIGDTIYTIRTNMEKKPKYEKMGLVRTSYEVFKGEGEIVLYCEHHIQFYIKNQKTLKINTKKMINLKGMTWDHSRGFDPMVATSKNFRSFIIIKFQLNGIKDLYKHLQIDL